MVKINPNQRDGVIFPSACVRLKRMVLFFLRIKKTSFALPAIFSTFLYSVFKKVFIETSKIKYPEYKK